MLMIQESFSSWHSRLMVIDVISAKCPAGEYSIDGLENCLACAIGFYQHAEGNRRCIKCPGATTTTSEAAKSVSECGGKSSHIKTNLIFHGQKQGSGLLGAITTKGANLSFGKPPSSLPA